MEQTTRQRVLGSFYTPDWIARWMVSQALSTHDQSAADFSCRILDPACGDGAFVLPVLDWIATHRGVSPIDLPGRLAIVREHMFGVDADAPAIAALHQRVAEWIGCNPGHEAEIANILATNFPCGDALLGTGWLTTPKSFDPTECAAAGSQGRRQRTIEWIDDSINVQYPVPSPPYSVLSTNSPAPIHVASLTAVTPINWSTTFPLVAAAGGFDLVIGNPPYRRERNAKHEFDQIANSAIGQKWRTARMDLWHYFFHRGMDLLKPAGRLSFIVNSYWTSSTAAKSLRERLVSEASVEELVFLGSARLFRGVSGRHMIFRVRNAHDPETRCRVLDLSNESRSQIETALSRSESAIDVAPSAVSTVRTVSQSDLWSDGQLRVDSIDRRDESIHPGPRLGEMFEVRQGMAENPPFVTKSAAAELGDLSLTGRGVFVLTAEEVAALNLNEREQSLLRPYYALSAVGRFHVAPIPSHQVLYLTRLTAPSLDEFPRIARHLAGFRTVLLRRREVQSGQIAWWHLHWPREERLFIAPRILCLQMGHEPRFAFVEPPTYVGFSMHVIVCRVIANEIPLSLPALTAVLNSSHARHWFETHAKRRGAHLDISGTILKQFPLPTDRRLQIEADLEHLTRTWPATRDSEVQLTRLVDALYATSVELEIA